MKESWWLFQARILQSFIYSKMIMDIVSLFQLCFKKIFFKGLRADMTSNMGTSLLFLSTGETVTLY